MPELREPDPSSERWPAHRDHWPVCSRYRPLQLGGDTPRILAGHWVEWEERKKRITVASGHNYGDREVGGNVPVVGWLTYLDKTAVGSPALSRGDETMRSQSNRVRG